MLPKQPNQSLIDGIRCLQGVIARNEPVGVAEAAKELDLESTRAHRLLRTLAHIGLLEQTSNRKYVAGPAFTVLAAQAIQGSPLLREALPALEQLRKDTSLIVAMGVQWMRTVSYAYHARDRSPLESATGRQEVWPAERSGLGEVLLAKLTDAQIRDLYRHDPPEQGMRELIRSLREIRKQGYAFIATTRGHHTLAIVLPSDDNVAIGLSGNIGAKDAPRLLERLNLCAAEIATARRNVTR